jgi:gliding motility-associated-like protein
MRRKSNILKKPSTKGLMSLRVLRAAFLFISLFSFAYSSKACTPLTTPTLISQSISGNNLLLNWQSNTVFQGCTYTMQVEIVCLNTNFTGNPPFFLSSALNKTLAVQAFPQQTVDISNFCPGRTYQFRGRELEGTAPVMSNWTQTYTFTVPGTLNNPSLNVTASNNIICPPQTSQLNAGINNPCGGPFTYAWTPTIGLSATNIANPIASPASTTNYSVTVTSGPYGCWSANGLVIISTGIIPPTVGNGIAIPAIICAGKSTTLILSSFLGNIQWQSSTSGSGPWTNVSGAQTNSYVISPSTGNTCYRASVSSCSGTVTSNAFCVSVNPLPVLVPTVLQISCTNSVAIANMGNPGTSGAPISATWSPAPLSLQSSSTIATYNLPSVVTITANFSDGCISTTSLTIKPPPPLPNFTITNVAGSNSITCTFPTIDLVATNNYTYGTANYFWSSASFTAITQTVTILNPATYSCVVTDPATNCSVTRTIQIFLNNSPPTASVFPVNQLVSCGPGIVATCTGIAVSPSINVTHYWYPPGVTGFPFSASGQFSIYNPIVGTTTYVLTNNINGCSTTRTVQVVSTGGSYPTFGVTSLANFTLGCSTKSIGDINIVGANTNPPGGTVTYTLLPPASTGTNYLTNSISTYTVNSPGNYSVIVRDNANQCETRLLLSILQNTFGPAVVTSVETLTLSCFTPSVTLRGNSSRPNVSYTWKKTSLPPLVVDSLLPVNITPAGASVASATVIDNYTLTVLDAGNLCTTSTVVALYQNTRPPKANIALSYTALTCAIYSVNATNNSTTGILPGTFFGTGNLNAILWQGPSPQANLVNSSTYQGFTPGAYTMTVRDMNNGCTSVTTALLGDNRIYPVISVAKTYSLDCGSPTLTITAVFIPSTGLNYQWNVAQGSAVGTVTTPILLTNLPGEYQIVATSQTNACSSYSFVEVVSGKLFADVTADNTSGYAPFTVSFVNNSASSLNSNSITSIWSFGNGTTRTTTTNINTSAVYQQPGTYTMTMYASKGACLDTAIKIIKVDIPSKLEVPNVFTPNGDNSNDIFFVKTANLTEISAVIYDRWGTKIYELTTEKGNIAWDGKTQTGKEAPDGTYFFVIKASGKDGQSYDTKGTLSLFR